MKENLRTEWVDVDERQQLVEWNNGLEEEVKMLRRHVADMYQARVAGKAPIPPPPGFSNDVITQTLASPYHPCVSVTLPSDIIPDHSSLTQMEEKPKEDFGKFWLKWSEKVARDSLTMERKDSVEPPRQQGPAVVLAKCPQYQCHPRGYNWDPHVPSRCHFSPHNSQRHTSTSKYPAPQKAYPPHQAYHKHPGSGFKPSQAFRNERLLKREEKAPTPIKECYASLFERLNYAGLIEPLPGYTPNLGARSIDHTARCAYHSNFRGHNIESCHSLKKEIERMIHERVIVIDDGSEKQVNPLGILTKVEDMEDAKLSGYDSMFDKWKDAPFLG